MSREPGELFGPRFELFADVLSVGIATTVACLPVVTAPAALSTACEVLRGGRGSFWRAFSRRARWRADLLAGLAMIGVASVLAADFLLAGAGLPGGKPFTVALALVAVALAVIGLRAVAMPARGWRRAYADAAAASFADPGGSLLLLLAFATAALCAWVLPPVAALVPGPLAMAACAMEQRREASQ
ncbi:hypothetical protein [Amycolatopsis sp. CA-230715]|uniref:hypothetical protein n=1 Tax=Amycolatopsis sp. CA-230715 TaxID=2745196 RepID=UPI001C00CDF7|nr:hypothetical protein [Amycolatopsis sp. CA-230715]QWF78038.1 hypothetical protein HUW46_01433 [Amycolatopsis sp. CA-230715]